MSFGMRHENSAADIGEENPLPTVLTDQIAEAQLKIGLQVAGVGLVQFNYETDQATLSPEAAAIFGIPTDELTISRDRLHSTFHPDDLEDLLALIQQVLDPAGNGWFAREYRVVWPSGEIRWLNIRKQVFFESVGETLRPHSAILAAVDITEGKRAEMARRESERKFSALFNHTFEMLGIVSTAGVLQEVNQSALDSINASREEVLGKKLWDTPWWAYSTELQTELKAEVARAVRGECIHHELNFPTRDGRMMTTDFSLKPVFDEAGQVTMLIAEGYDVTERKQAEAALKESEDRFRALADNISQLAWMADETGWIFWYNRRWFEYTGTTIAEMEGWDWQKVHHPDHIDRVVQGFRRAVVEVGERWEDTFPLRGKDGNYRWFLSRAFPIHDATGKIVRWFGTNTDVTELKTIQAELENRNEELDNFVHIVSHDLKAPLRGISSLSEWIEEDLAELVTSETQQQMQLLRQRVKRMSVMIDGLLDYARVGMTEEDVETVEVAELILEVIDSIAPPAHFQIKLDPNLPTLQTKRLLLFQVFTNLLSNAVKHHDGQDGEIQITVTPQNHHYQFSVTDNGPGIPEEYQHSIFTIFRTGKPGTNTDSTGVGLAIVKKIIEAQGGTIQLESQVGQGTTFQFTWPK